MPGFWTGQQNTAVLSWRIHLFGNAPMASTPSKRPRLPLTARLTQWHRWVVLVFLLPLLVLFISGLVLSFEPIANDRQLIPRQISLAQVEQILATHDPQSKANTLQMRSYDNLLMLSEGRAGPVKRIDIPSNALAPKDKTYWSTIFTAAKKWHETLLFDLRWLVTASSFALLVILALGLGMGWPKFRQTLSAWHRTSAWFLAPLLILSPLSGLALSYGITLNPPPAKITGPVVPLKDAIKIISAKHDLASVVWIRPQAGATRVRLYDGGEAKVLAVTPSGLVEGRTAWPRALHEGVWAGAGSGALNVLVSIAFIALMITGLTLWLQKRSRLRRRELGLRN
jgi:uncharacterized iron-regulated membrane protein